MNALAARARRFIAETRKFLIASSAALAEILALGVLHGSAQHYVQVAAGVVGAILVYLTPNEAKKPA